MGVTPLVSTTDTPANIIWENLGVSGKSRRIRMCLSWTAAIVLLLAALIGTIITMYQGKELLKEYNTNVECPLPFVIKSPLFKRNAVIDQELNPADRKGLMTCYCKEKFSELGPIDTLKVSFEDVGLVNGETVTKKYCEEYLKVLAIENGLTYGTSILLMTINVVMCQIMSYMVEYEKHHSQNDLTMS